MPLLLRLGAAFKQWAYRYKLKQERWIAVEGLHTGQFVYCGAKSKLDVGSTFLLAKMPEGTVISMVECMIVGHSDDGKKTCTGITDPERQLMAATASGLDVCSSQRALQVR